MKNLYYVLLATLFFAFQLSSCTKDKNEEEIDKFVTPYTLSGAFTVSDACAVNFAPGNLQYQASSKKWRFANSQFEIIGYNNPNLVGNDTTERWADLFYWGTGKNPHLGRPAQPFSDWGKNIIQNKNGLNEANTWRTLSKDEWKYLFFYRNSASKLFGFARVNGICGLVILPDDWNYPKDIKFSSSVSKGLQRNESMNCYSMNMDSCVYDHNTISLETWEKMESYGAVFLPSAGTWRYGELYQINYSGGYFSCNKSTNGDPYFVSLCYYCLSPLHIWGGDWGWSVRLVKDIN